MRDAVAAGAVSVDQARIIGRTVEMVLQQAGAATTDKAVVVLLDWAGEFDPDGLRKLSHRILDHVAPQVADAAQRRALQAAEKRAQRDRYLTRSPRDEGRIRLSQPTDTPSSSHPRWIDPRQRPRRNAYHRRC